MDNLTLLTLLKSLQDQVREVQKLEGPRGLQGPEGPQGIQGPKGEQGDTGREGPIGPAGADGATGADGRDGVDGVGVTGAYTAADGDLVFTLSDGTELSVELPESLTESPEGRTYIVGQGRSSVYSISEGKTAANLADWTYVTELNDLPTPVSGVITLADDHSYFFIGTVDLLGNRMVGGSNTCILGPSSENAFITSTGLGAGVALFTSTRTTPIRHVTFQDVDTLFDIDGAGNTTALDWTGVNFVNIPNIGVLKNFSNFVYTKGAFLGAQGLVIDGTFGTASIADSLLQGLGSAGTIVKIPATAVVQRRFRIIYSSVVAFGSTVGIDVSVSATVPAQSYILDTINFSGGSTYLSGVGYLDNETLFVSCVGIPNSREVSQYYMHNNTTTTVVSTSATPVKVLGTTTNAPVTTKFTNTDNRATYTGSLTRTFHVIVNLSLSSGNNQLIGCYVAKNGVELSESEMYASTDSNGALVNVTIQTLVELSTNDYIEIFVENDTTAQNILVDDLNVTIR